VVTRQQQVERRTAKVHLSETDVLPLCHATNQPVCVTKQLFFTAAEIRQLKTARGHMMSPPLHVCNGLASPADTACCMYCDIYPPYVSMEGYIQYWLLFFSQSGYRYLGDSGTDRREILHDGTYRSQTDLLPFGGITPGIHKSEILGLNFGHLITNISKTVSHRAICQLEPNISSTRAFNKCKSQGGSPPRQGVHPPYDRFVSCSHTCCKITRYMAALVLCRILLPCPDIILHKV